MKSKRATKLLACVLASSLCTVPVFASNTERTSQASGTINSTVEVESAVVHITVPTRMNVQINPFYDTSSSIALNKGTLKSEEFIVSNNTSSNDGSTGIPVLLTTTAKVTKIGDGVQLYYHTVSTDDASTVKKIHMKMASANATVQISQNTYDMAKGVPVTGYDTQLKVKVNAPTIASQAITAAGYGGFAVSGNANIGADWQDGEDVQVSFKYAIKPVGASYQLRAQTATIQDVTLTSANATGNSNVELVPNTVLSKTFMGDATPVAVVLHDPENAFADVMAVNPTDNDKVKFTANADGSYKIEMVAGGSAIKYLTGFSKKNIEAMVALSDGRKLPFKVKLNP